MTAAEMLTDLGHEVVEAGSVAGAEEKLASEDFQLMLADLGLPDGSGVELVRNTLNTYPAISVIVASGSAIAAEFDDIDPSRRPIVLGKPFDEKGIKEAVRKSTSN